MSLRRYFQKLFPRTAQPWTEKFKVGRGTYGKPEIKFETDGATLEVGAFCSFAGEIKIFLGGNHRTDWITTYPFMAFRESAKGIEGHPATRGDVIIENDVWIGNGATILSGVRIGNGAVVGACAVVSKDVPPYGIVVGNPARLMRFRFGEEEIARLQEIAWWNWPDAMLDAAMPLLLSGDMDAFFRFADAEENAHL